MSNWKRNAALLETPDLPPEAFKHVGDRRIKPQGGDGGQPADTTQTQISELPEWAKPYAKSTMERASALSDTPYQAYGGNRIAGFSPMQQQAQAGAAGMQPSQQTADASNMAATAGLAALGTNYQGGQFGNQYSAPGQYQGGQFGTGFQGGQFGNQYQGIGQYQGGQFGGGDVQGAGLRAFQMGPAQQVRTQSFAQPGSAQAYMSPYMQNVVDIQQREAQRTADIASTQRGAQAVGAGAYGGSRQAIMDAEAARNLATQKGDIQATGQQAAFQSAQQQFNAEQAARLQAQQANQQAGLSVAGQNLASRLGVQQLGAGQSLQAQLANQQAALQSQQMGEQSRQYGAGLGMQQAQLGAQYGLAGQQAAEQSRQFGAGQDLQAQQLAEQSRQYGYGQDMSSAALAAQYGQSAQQLGEQSRQYGAGLGMQGLQTAGQMAGQLGTLGGQQFQQGMDINKLQSAYGGQEQALRQQGLTQAYQDFMNQQNQPYKQVGFMSDIIRGLPLGQQSTKSIYEADPSMAQNLTAAGTAAYGLSKFMAKGGEVKSYANGGSVDSQNNVAQIVHGLSDQQLTQAEEAAKLRGDVDQLDAIQTERAMRASLSNGIAGAVPNDMADRMTTNMASGGIVAFATGGMPTTAESLARMRESEFTPSTEEERIASTKTALTGLQGLYGASKTDPYMAEVKKERDEIKAGRGVEEAKGFGALKAAAAIVNAKSLTRGLGAAGVAFGEEVMKIKKENIEADRLLRASEITLATAQQSREDGMTGKAQEQQKHAEDMRYKGVKLKQDGAEKEATIVAGIENAKTQAAATMANANRATDLDKLIKANYDAMIEAGAPANAATRAKAASAATDMQGKYAGSAREDVARLNADTKARDEAHNRLMMNKEYRTAVSKNPALATQMLNSVLATDKSAATGKPTAEPAPATIKPGTVMQGYRFKGGIPSDQANWEKVK